MIGFRMKLQHFIPYSLATKQDLRILHISDMVLYGLYVIGRP